MLESQRTEPTALAFDEAERHVRPYPKGDIRYIPTTDEEIEDIKKVTLDQVKDFYSRFYGSSTAELVAVGDFEPEALEKQIGSLFQGWTSKEHYARVITNFKDVPPVNRSMETPDKANAMLVAIQPLKMDDQSPDYPALLLANYMLGGGFLNSRLATRIREKDGLSYSVASSLRIPTKEDGGEFFGYAISAPQNTTKVEDDFNEELKRALTNGFTDQEVASAKSGWLQSRQVSRGQDNELTNRLISHVFWGRTMQWDADLEQRVAALKTSEINAALRKYVDPSKISFFKAGDFAKASTQPLPPNKPQ
jgi:zinc protease